jgi:hypothetical protein
MAPVQSSLEDTQLMSPPIELENRLDEVKKHAEEITAEAARDLERRLQDATRQASETAKAEAAERLRDYIANTRKSASILRARFKAMEKATSNLSQQLVCEREEWKNGLKQVAVEIMRRVDQETEARQAAQVRFGQELLRVLRESESRLQEELAELQEANEHLRERVTTLERPRGLKAVWLKFFGPRRPDELSQPD